MSVPVTDINSEIFYLSTIIVPIIFLLIFLWGWKTGQFSGDTESIKNIVLRDEQEDEEYDYN
jgi:cbb3-type cytochrome oxidase maturation protein